MKKRSKNNKGSRKIIKKVLKGLYSSKIEELVSFPLLTQAFLDDHYKSSSILTFTVDDIWSIPISSCDWNLPIASLGEIKYPKEDSKFLNFPKVIHKHSDEYVDVIVDVFKDKFDESQLTNVSIYLKNKSGKFISEFVDWLKIERRRRDIVSLDQEIKRFTKIFFSQFTNIFKRIVEIAKLKLTVKPQVVGFSFKSIITDTLFYSFASEEDNKLYQINLSGTLLLVK